MPVAAIVAGGPAERFGPDAQARIGQEVREAALALSEATPFLPG